MEMKARSKWLRMYKVFSLAILIIFQIYWYKWTRKSEAEWENLWSGIGKKFRTTLFELEGLLIKIGQFISIRSDLLPHAFIQELQDLTDKVPPSEWSEIQRILNEEWGSELSKKVVAIEKEAIASASIGEVYKGSLQDGSIVAIKVQRPDIQSIVHTDFRTLSILVWFADRFVPIPKGFINLKVLFQELKQVIERELDFTKEKETLLYFKDRFKDSEIVKIPDVHQELCTSKVLVMEWVEGKRLNDAAAVEMLEISRQDLARRLMKIFLPQWLEPGMFHADPHPGNVLFTREGRIILLDFGMAGEISKKDAVSFQNLIESILAKNYSKTVDCLSQLGFLLPEADAGSMEKLLSDWMSFDFSQLKDIDLIALKLELNDLITALPIQVPTRFVFLGRSFMTIEGVVRHLVPEDDLLDHGKPVFKEWLSSQGNKWSFIWSIIQSQPLFKIFYSAAEFLETPRKLETMKVAGQRRQFQFSIYENRKNQLFQLFMLGLTGSGFGIYLEEILIMQLSAGIAAIGLAGYGVNSWRLRKWLKYMPERRR